MEAAGAPAIAAMASPEPQDAKPTTVPVPVAKPANALTPPTSEENNEPKQEQEDSDLSDLELDDDNEVEIQPDHYWDGGNGGKIPVFKPTMEQFRSFKKFIDKIDKYGMKSGIVKVIPPKEWRDALPALDDHIKKIKIKNPITQEFNGTFGTYTQQNVEKQRSYNLPEWKALTEETQHQPPARRGERRRNQDKVVRGGGNMRGRTSGSIDVHGEPKQKKKPGRPRRNPLPTAEVESGDESKERHNCVKVPQTPDSPATKPTVAKKASKPRGRPPKAGGLSKSVTSRRLNNIAEAADYIDEAVFKDFNYRMDGLDEFTPDRCAELETHYWKSLGFNQPMYAADMPGSLFDDTTTSWNVAKLENLLDVLGTKVPGVNTAYLYMGMWKATFAWHLEDVDLYSINYIHFGAPKQWYSISQEDARRFEHAMKSIWPVDSKNCDQFLRHKTYLISPDVLQKQYNVKVNKLVHYEGEFVVTFPYGYHSGYNIGYNCAESVNFATESWLEFGRIARKCNCEADNVWVDVSEIERKLRGEPTPEYYEETDDDDDELSDGEGGILPSPPASVKGKSRGRKRKQDTKEEKVKKRKKIRIRIKAPSREPCAMCPNDNPWEPLLPTDNGKKAHRSCALYTPETWIEQDETGNEKVCGVAGIDRARLELKCNFCRSKRGACFQCSSKKCTRAFHATCALAAGVQIDAGTVPTFGEDGTEYFEEGFDFRCRYHRPKMPKNFNVENLENSKRINNYAKELRFNDVVQAQYVGSEVFAGLVVENRPNELSVVVDVFPEGDRLEVEWKWLCLLDPVDSQRPKPSACALPMPHGMNKKAVSVANRQDGVPTQEDVFHNNPDHKWHDFYNPHMPPPGYESAIIKAPVKLKVNINAPDQLYYYLPAISTEAKCFFTDKVCGTEINPKAHFLDRIAARPSFQHSTHRQSLAAARPSPVPGQSQFRQQTPVSDVSRTHKPYVYKPKQPAQSNAMWGVDPQSLAGQRSFLADATRRSSDFMLPQPNHEPSQYGYCETDATCHATPAKAFPREQYYSTEILPAAYPGEYSGFTNAARRESQSSQGGAYTSNYQSISQQRTHIKNIAPVAPMMGGSAMSPHSYGAMQSRPSSSAHSRQSPRGAPHAPATTSLLTSKRTETPPGFLNNIQKYPYLLNSYLRKQDPYDSPYPLGGGFSSPYQPLSLSQTSETTACQKSTSAHTPSTSVSSARDSSRRTSQQWTPPSQAWQSAGFSDQQTPPPQSQVASRKYPQPTYQTPQEFQQSFQQLPSTASRDGAAARRLREQGYGPYAPHAYVHHQKNSFGQAYDTASMWQSPKAPTPSPLSDSNTLYSQTPTNVATWTIPQKADLPPLGARSQVAGYGPTLPQMGGHETWRFV